MLYYIVFDYALCSALFVMAKAIDGYLKCSFKAQTMFLEVGCVLVVVKRQVCD